MYKYIYIHLSRSSQTLPIGGGKKPGPVVLPMSSIQVVPASKKMGQKHLEIAQLFKDFVQKNPGRIADLQFFWGGK